MNLREKFLYNWLTTHRLVRYRFSPNYNFWANIIMFFPILSSVPFFVPFPFQLDILSTPLCCFSLGAQIDKWLVFPISLGAGLVHHTISRQTLKNSTRIAVTPQHKKKITNKAVSSRSVYFEKSRLPIIFIPGNQMNNLCCSRIFLWPLLSVLSWTVCFPVLPVVSLGPDWRGLPVNESYQRDFSVGS